jgi:hypothetical protein
MNCPHCEKPIPTPPEAWAWIPPWQCSHCAGLFGISIQEEAFRIPSDIKPLWPLFSWKEASNFGFYAGTRNYVYAICYPSGMPFYVGRGIRDRVCQHVDETYKLDESLWTEKHRLILSLADRNESEWYHFLALVETKQQAAGIEQIYIQRWGLRSRGGMLTNRDRPTCNQFEGDLPKPPTESRAIEQATGPRMIHHPHILAGHYGRQMIDFNCPICLQQCISPIELAAKNVQCPSCAHFIVPLNPHRKATEIQCFTAVEGASDLE